MIAEPRANPLLLGHEAAEAAMLESVRAGRVHHAWLLTGPPGIGKATLAFRFARWLLAGARGDTLALDPAHPVFRRVAAGTHADLLTVERTWNDKTKRMRGEIVVEDAAGITPFLRLTPAEGGWRVVIVDGADYLNRTTANGLLKILEEPPPRAVLLLPCGAPGRLLPTIRSRCRTLRLSALGDEAMRMLLERALPDMDGGERARLSALAHGSPGLALALAEEGGLTLAALVEDVLRDAPLSVGRAHEVADALGRSDAAFSTFMELLRGRLAASVRQAARGRGAPHARLVETRPLDAWSDVWHALTRLQDETERFHLDKRQAVVTGLSLLGGT